MEQTFSFQITPPDPDRLLYQVDKATGRKLGS